MSGSSLEVVLHELDSFDSINGLNTSTYVKMEDNEDMINEYVDNKMLITKGISNVVIAIEIEFE
jgi:hypothetical protein